MSTRTWFITATSGGLAHELTSAALARGDRVVGTARDPNASADLLAQHPDTFEIRRLDITNRAAVFDAVRRAYDAFGELDIVVSSAGDRRNLPRL